MCRLEPSLCAIHSDEVGAGVDGAEGAPAEAGCPDGPEPQEGDAGGPNGQDAGPEQGMRAIWQFV